MALPVSIAAMLGWLDLPSAMPPATWHAHELLFGYAPAAVAGFLLTAVPNWTGRLPLRGWALAALAGIWLAGRLALGGSAWIGAAAAAVIDCMFLAALAAAILRELVAGRNWRNLPVVAALTVLLVANALDHAQGLGAAQLGATGQRLAIAALVVLLSLIGGRIVPSFTRNWLAQRGAKHLPSPFGAVDRASIAATVAALAVWVLQPFASATAFLLAGAAGLQAVRAARWQGQQTLAEPLLWVLHVGYFWVPAGLALQAAAAWGAVPPAVATHALTIGAIATMTVAVMSRATLGHTGRQLRARPALTAAFLLLQTAALARIASALLTGGSGILLFAAAAAWVGAYLMFLWACGPMLFGRRAAPAH